MKRIACGLMLVLVGCGKNHNPVAPVVPHPVAPVHVLQSFAGPALPAAVADALQACDTVAAAPNHGLVYTWFQSSHLSDQPVFTLTDGAAIRHADLTETKVWDPQHKALWSTDRGLRIMASNGTNVIPILAENEWGGNLDCLTLTADSRPAMMMSSENGATAWFNGKFYVWTALSDSSSPGLLRTVAVDRTGGRLLVTAKSVGTMDDPSFSGAWDAEAVSGAGYQYFRDTTVTYACYGRDSKELVLFVPGPADMTDPYHPKIWYRIYVLRTGGDGRVLEQNLLTSAGVFPRATWSGEIVAPISPSGKVLSVLLADGFIHQFHLDTGEAVKLNDTWDAAGRSGPSYRE